MEKSVEKYVRTQDAFGEAFYAYWASGVDTMMATGDVTRDEAHTLALRDVVLELFENAAVMLFVLNVAGEPTTEERATFKEQILRILGVMASQAREGLVKNWDRVEEMAAEETS